MTHLSDQCDCAVIRILNAMVELSNDNQTHGCHAQFPNEAKCSLASIISLAHLGPQSDTGR